MRIDCLLCLATGGVEVDDALAVVLVGADYVAHVDPYIADSNAVKVSRNERGRNQLAKRNRLVVVEVVVGRLAGRHFVEPAEQLAQPSIGRVALVGKKAVGNRQVIVNVLLQQLSPFIVRRRHAGHHLFQQVGRLAHCRNDHHQRRFKILPYDFRHVANGFCAVDGCPAEFEDVHSENLNLNFNLNFRCGINILILTNLNS